MSAAKSYARALYEVAKDSGTSSEVMDQMETQMDLLQAFIAGSKDAKIALLGPITTVKEKTALIEDISQKLGFSSQLKEFLVLLARKGRLSLLSGIRDAFNSVRLTLEGGVAGRLVAAEAMGDADIGTLAKAFSHKLGKKVAFRVSTDPSLLAGMKVTVNGVTYDGTLRSQLQKLRDSFVTGLPGAHA